jgi:hypothetical protein
MPKLSGGIISMGTPKILGVGGSCLVHRKIWYSQVGLLLFTSRLTPIHKLGLLLVILQILFTGKCWKWTAFYWLPIRKIDHFYSDFRLKINRRASKAIFWNFP